MDHKKYYLKIKSLLKGKITWRNSHEKEPVKD